MLAKSAAAKFPKTFVNAVYKVSPAVSGPKKVSMLLMQPAVLKPTAAPFAPAPAPKNDLPILVKLYLRLLTCLFVPFTV